MQCHRARVNLTFQQILIEFPKQGIPKLSWSFGDSQPVSSRKFKGEDVSIDCLIFIFPSLSLLFNCGVLEYHVKEPKSSSMLRYTKLGSKYATPSACLCLTALPHTNNVAYHAYRPWTLKNPGEIIWYLECDSARVHAWQFDIRTDELDFRRYHRVTAGSSSQLKTSRSVSVRKVACIL